MKYQMNQKVFSLGDRFTIQDEEGQDVLQVVGKILSVGKKLSIQDMQGTEVAFIAQRVLSFKKRYEVTRSGYCVAEVVKEFSLFKDRYTVDAAGDESYEVNGNFLDHEYVFLRGGREVAGVSKAFFSWGDTYGIDVAPGEDDIAILATVVVIDLENQSSGVQVGS